MITTKRFERAVSKLYNAFHNGTLDAMDCEYCAVGNLCNNDTNWMSCDFDSCIGNRVIPIHLQKISMYSQKELSNIEHIFIFGSKSGCDIIFQNNVSNFDVEKSRYTKEQQKELQFKGLCAVIEYLCELDNIPNIMDYTSLFETENNKPIKELIF